MGGALVTVDKIDKLYSEINGGLLDNTIKANQSEAYFWATCRIRYKQVFDTDVDKGIGAKGRAKAPGLAGGGVDAGGEVDAGFQVEKSRDGEVYIEEQMMVASDRALEEGIPGAVLEKMEGDPTEDDQVPNPFIAEPAT